MATHASGEATEATTNTSIKERGSLHAKVSKPQSFRKLLIDFFRLYDTAKLDQIDTILLTHTDDNEEEEDEEEEEREEEEEEEEGNDNDLLRGYTQLASFLEEKHGVPGAFTKYKFNFSSQYFDPLACLYDGHVLPPIPLARPLDNLHKAQVLLPPSSSSSSSSSGQQQQGLGAATQVRLGILHSASVALNDTRWRAGELPPGFFEALADDKAPDGSPMAHLKELFTERTKVRVLACMMTCSTRRRKRGAMQTTMQDEKQPVITRIRGYLRGFDAECNMILVDAEKEVVEVRYDDDEEEEDGGSTNKDDDLQQHVKIRGSTTATTTTAAVLPRFQKIAQLMVLGHTVLSVGRDVSDTFLDPTRQRRKGVGRGSERRKKFLFK